MRIVLCFALTCVIGLLATPADFAQTDNSSDPLVRVLVTKGVLTPEEARAIVTNASPAEQRDRLATLLRDKGVISAAEFEAVRANAPAPNASVALVTADYKPHNPEPPPPAAAPQASRPHVKFRRIVWFCVGGE